jgi:hypothetical protein
LEYSTKQWGIFEKIWRGTVITRRIGGDVPLQNVAPLPGYQLFSNIPVEQTETLVKAMLGTFRNGKSNQLVTNTETERFQNRSIEKGQLVA